MPRTGVQWPSTWLTDWAARLNLAATVIVWAASLLAAFVLPFRGLRRFLEKRAA